MSRMAGFKKLQEGAAFLKKVETTAKKDTR
jgi:hypothetical protein